MADIFNRLSVSSDTLLSSIRQSNILTARKIPFYKDALEMSEGPAFTEDS